MGYFCDPQTGGPVQLDLRSINGHDFRLLRRIAYRHDDHAEQFVVPGDLEEFRTDFASVPGVLTWLVPRSGIFLPAAVLHDALVWPGKDYLGPPVTRREADRIFRDALVELGTGRVRGWLMWAAVTVASRWLGEGPGTPGRSARRIGVVLSVGVVLAVLLALLAGLAGLTDGPPGVGPVLGVSGARAASSLGAAALWAFVVPALLAPTWGRDTAAAAIAGWALVLVGPVTVASAVLAACYLVLERMVSGPVVDGRRRRPGDRKARAQAAARRRGDGGAPGSR